MLVEILIFHLLFLDFHNNYSLKNVQYDQVRVPGCS
jgi:hypothetical protein